MLASSTNLCKLLERACGDCLSFNSQGDLLCSLNPTGDSPIFVLYIVVTEPIEQRREEFLTFHTCNRPYKLKRYCVGERGAVPGAASPLHQRLVPRPPRPLGPRVPAAPRARAAAAPPAARRAAPGRGGGGAAAAPLGSHQVPH